MDNIIFSVIIPVYNCEKYISRGVKSIINQPALKDYFEILIVDDGSTDNTPKVCDELAQEFKQITVFHKKNEGVAKARNYALERVKGKYVNFMDSDDWWNENAINDQVIDCMISNDYKIINFAHQDVSTNYKYRKVYYPVVGSYQDRCFQTKFYLVSFLKENNIEFPNLVMREDRFFLETSYHKAGEGGDYCFDKTILYCYWMNPDSVCHVSFNPEKFKKKYTLYTAQKDFIINNGLFTEKDYYVDIKKQVTSALTDCCALKSYKFTKEYFSNELFNVMNDDNIKMWSTLEKKLTLWKKHPVIFYTKCKFKPGITFLFRSIRKKSKLAMSIYNVLFFKYKKKWDTIK